MRNPVTAVDFLSHQRGDDLWIVCPYPGCRWSKLVGGPFTIKDLLRLANKHLDEVNGHNASNVWAEAMNRKWNRGIEIESPFHPARYDGQTDADA